jgi:hypothetical protein
MTPPNERMSFDDWDSTQNTYDCSPERSLRSGDNDAEKFLLLGPGNESIRKGSLRSPWSTRVLTSVTVLNVVLFVTSVVILASNRVSHMSDQDYWRATSYYCTYHPLAYQESPNR